MALDPKLRAFLEIPGMQLAAPPPEVSVDMVREAVKQLRPQMTPPPVHQTRDITVPGPAGDLRVRLYYPSSTPGLPLVVFYHGGGWALGDLDGHDILCRTLTNESGCVIASVDYRLAPEAKFPGPLEDCYAALLALVARAAALGVDADRVAVCGDSAGANLATAVCMLARDRRGPALKYQALICPVTDVACDSASMQSLAEGYMLSRGLMLWFWDLYLARPADGANPLASPLRATDLAGLPPATVITAEFDPLRDEGEAYADRLLAAGIPVVVRRYLGMIHDFVALPLATEVANRGLADVGQDLRTALIRSSDSRIATAQKMYQSAMSGDWQAIAQIVTDDFEITEASALPFGGVYRGVGALQELLTKVGGMLTLQDVRFKQIMAAGDEVVVILDLIADRQGKPETLNVVEIIRFRGERICSLQPFYFDAAQVAAVIAKR